MSVKSLLSEARRRLFKPSMWSGNFTTWQDAVQNSRGYSSNEILEKVRSATLKVKNGEAVYERDSVLFDKIEYSWPLLSSMMWVAAKNKGSLKILDIGGSLGTSYFQNKIFLDTLENIEWNIVEQENFVATGRDCIETESLKFFYSIEECINKKGRPDIVILAASLPYFEQPYLLIDKIINYDIPHLIVDNTFFNYQDRDRITVQKVTPDIYPASYPSWFLSYNKVLEVISRKYHIVSEHFNETSIYLDRTLVKYRGFLAMHRRSSDYTRSKKQME